MSECGAPPEIAELLEDIQKSIELAAADDHFDLVSALLQLRSATLGDCNDPNCGNCPLQVNQCLDPNHEKAEEIAKAIKDSMANQEQVWKSF